MHQNVHRPKTRGPALWTQLVETLMTSQPQFALRFARDAADLRAVQRLRYDVFVAELGGDGPMVDHDARLEADELDPHFSHLMLLDEARGGDVEAQVVGVYRLMDDAQAAGVGRFYSEAEYDLTPLKTSGRKLLELGRSCLHRDYRGGAAMFHLWNGLAAHVIEQGIEVLFGTASFHGTDVAALSGPLSLLHHRHLAPEDLRVVVRSEHGLAMDILPEDQIDRPKAMLATPALIKAYLRLGGFVGQGAYVDEAFNTTDVCLILDRARMNERQTAIYTRGLGA